MLTTKDFRIIKKDPVLIFTLPLALLFFSNCNIEPCNFNKIWPSSFR